MHRPLLLRGARQLLTLRGPQGPRRGADCLDLGVINDGSILIRNGRIVCVGQSRRVVQRELGLLLEQVQGRREQDLPVRSG